MTAEEDKRKAEAKIAADKAAEAERLAREAEHAEQEALKNAAVGEIGVNVAEVTQQADAAFQTFERASRCAAVAAKDSKVKVGGGLGKAASLSTVETLHVDDWSKANFAIGMTDGIREAILTGARAYRTANGNLPDGITATTERVL